MWVQPRGVNRLINNKLHLAVVLTGLVLTVLALALLPSAAWAQPLRLDGCGATAPAKPLASILVEGRKRYMITSVPKAYQNKTRHHLVMAFHGRTNTNAQVKRYFDLEGHGGTPAIFVYPNGLTTENHDDDDSEYSWWDIGNDPKGLRDFAFVDAMLKHYRSQYCIGDVFAVGYSLGASFANSLACARGDQLRGIATLGGGIERIKCTGRVAAMLIHNPEDRLAPIKLGVAAKERFRRHAGYAETTQPVEPRSYNCVRYGPQSSPYPLVWCPHNKNHNRRGRYYPHNWPPGTGAVMMNFFNSLPPEGPAQTLSVTPGRKPVIKKVD